jgi:excisionase family DNA binding protein
MSTDARPKPPPKPPTPPPADAAILKLEEAGYLLGRISARSVRRLIDEGKLAAVRVTVGGQLRVELAEVNRFLRASRFVERPEAGPDAEASATSAADRQVFRERIKADWNTGEDLIDDAPKRKGRGVKA